MQHLAETAGEHRRSTTVLSLMQSTDTERQPARINSTCRVCCEGDCEREREREEQIDEWCGGLKKRERERKREKRRKVEGGEVAVQLVFHLAKRPR